MCTAQTFESYLCGVRFQNSFQNGQMCLSSEIRIKLLHMVEIPKSYVNICLWFGAFVLNTSSRALKLHWYLIPIPKHCNSVFLSDRSCLLLLAEKLVAY